MSEYINNNRIVRCPNLIPSRTFGDYRGKSYGIRRETGIITEPECYDNLPLSQIKAIILATDGVWDTISHEHMRDIVEQAYDKCMSAHDTASHIIRSTTGHDNATALVIFPQYIRYPYIRRSKHS